MKKLFETIKAWLRSRVTAMKSEKGRMKSEKVKGKQSIVNSPLSIVNSKKSLTLPEVQAVLCSKYELRYNLLSEQSEYRERGSVGDFLPISKRVYMTWLMDIQADGYNYTWLEGVRIAAESLHIPSYHPVTHYFASLPQWDGTDRLRPLMQRLTDDDTLVDYLCRWMLALVAQAQGREEALYANSVAPILISESRDGIRAPSVACCCLPSYACSIPTVLISLQRVSVSCVLPIAFSSTLMSLIDIPHISRAP